MDITYYIESGLLEKYACEQLDPLQTALIDQLLSTSLELGEALENIYIKMEGSRDSVNEPSINIT